MEGTRGDRPIWEFGGPQRGDRQLPTVPESCLESAPACLFGLARVDLEEFEEGQLSSEKEDLLKAI